MLFCCSKHIEVNVNDLPVTIERKDHILSRSNISKNALSVLYRLKDAGYEAYLVGGGVRDSLLALRPKDFDIATNATPEQIQSVFRNCRLIGRRFRLAHVYFGRELIEVATFRAQQNPQADDTVTNADGMLLRDNTYGSLEEDALRRDFTINALYYDIRNFSIIDYADGWTDINSKSVRLIGEPEVRYREDPVRMLRAIRFATKLDFSIEKKTAEPISSLSHLLGAIPSARLFDEYIKLFMSGRAEQNFNLLRQYGLFKYLFPEADRCLDEGQRSFVELVRSALKNTDARVSEGKPVTPGFLVSVFLWGAVVRLTEKKQAKGEHFHPALQKAGQEVLASQRPHVEINRRSATMIREIWSLQPRLEKQANKKTMRLVGHNRFRAAYDFLLLRAEAGDADPETAQWWTEFQALQPVDEQASTSKGGRRHPSKQRPHSQKWHP